MKALTAVQWNGHNIVAQDMVTGITSTPAGAGYKISVVVKVEPGKNSDTAKLRDEIEKTLLAVPHVTSAALVFTAHQSPTQRQPHVPQKILLPNVRHVLAVASGKGGVGKSTTSVNLAAAFVQNGLKVGLLDADVYGPSIPRMLALTGRPRAREDKKLIPHERYGMSVMSMGFLISEDTPMIWRGPMVHGAITQLFRDVDWGTLDILVVDLPPGTGDAQLTLAQSAPLSGVVIVSTPQDIALIDARKGLAMFQKVGIPVLGIVENMSYFACPSCGERSDIFSHGGARKEADTLGIPFLGEVPLTISLRETSDHGHPLTLSEPEGSIATSYRSIAERLWTSLALA